MLIISLRQHQHHKVLFPSFPPCNESFQISCQMHECLDIAVVLKCNMPDAGNNGTLLCIKSSLEQPTEKYIPFMSDSSLRQRHYRLEPNVH